MQDIDEIPWYRQFWPWFVISLPAAAVAAGFVTFYLAGAEPAMVVDDYGQIATVTTRRAERARVAAQLGLDARVTFTGRTDERNGQVAIQLTQRFGPAGWPEGLLLQLVHPTSEARDRLVPLTGTEGFYSAVFSRPEGRYYVVLTDAGGHWRLIGELGRGIDSLRLVADGVDD
jgi:hypothetical protein